MRTAKEIERIRNEYGKGTLTREELEYLREYAQGEVRTKEKVVGGKK